jgi:hypothetical protein
VIDPISASCSRTSILLLCKQFGGVLEYNMSGEKTSVDDIWKQLSARTVPRFNLGSAGLPGVKTHTRVVDGTSRHSAQAQPEEEPSTSGLQIKAGQSVDATSLQVAGLETVCFCCLALFYGRHMSSMSAHAGFHSTGYQLLIGSR